jgi:hypothetical protein
MIEKHFASISFAIPCRFLVSIGLTVYADGTGFFFPSGNSRAHSLTMRRPKGEI